MKILFVGSGNSKFGISPTVKNQGDSLIRQNIDLHYFPVMGKGVKSYIVHLFKLKKILASNQFDLIHAHYGLSGVISQLAQRKEKIIISFMGSDLIGVVNKKGKYGLFGKVLVGINKCYMDKYDYIIVKSKQLSEKIKPGIKYEIIPNGVDLVSFNEKSKKEARRLLNIPPDKKLIIFIADPSRPEKNYLLAQESVKRLNDNSIVLSAVHGLTNEQLILYYNAADLLLLTSKHEGSPNIIKEAMACNCPIVSTDVGDVRWVIGNTEGCYITSSDPIGIAQKVMCTLEFIEKKCRTNGRDRIVELGLDSDTIATKIVAIYKKVLSSHSSKNSRTLT